MTASGPADLIKDLNKKAIDMTWVQPRNVIAVAIKKGGVGKTTLTAVIAATLAVGGHKVLVIDLNEQGNISQEFGVPVTGQTANNQPIYGDGGDAIAKAVIGQTPLKPVAVRDGVDLCVGGPQIHKVRKYMDTVGENEAPTVLATCVAQTAHLYDYIIIDSPPDDEDMITVVVAAARWIISPTKTDQSSKLGFVALAAIYQRVRVEYNPYVELLGAFIFGTSMKEGAKAAEEVRGELQQIMGEHGAACPHVVPHVESVGNLVRAWGMPVTELEAKAIAEEWPQKDIEMLQRVSKAWVRIVRYFLAELGCRRVGHRPGMVVRITDDGQPEYATSTSTTTSGV